RAPAHAGPSRPGPSHLRRAGDPDDHPLDAPSSHEHDDGAMKELAITAAVLVFAPGAARSRAHAAGRDPRAPRALPHRARALSVERRRPEGVGSHRRGAARSLARAGPLREPGHSPSESRGNRFMNPTRRDGFTLLEIMVVVLIIGMLMALIAPRIFGRFTQANVHLP